MEYQFRIKSTTDWANAPLLRVINFDSYQDAVIFAKGLSIEFNKECRMNEKNSRQGEYFSTNKLITKQDIG